MYCYTISAGKVNIAVELDDININGHVLDVEDSGHVTDSEVNHGDGTKVDVDDAKQEKNKNDEIPDNVLEDDDDPSFKRLCKCITLSIAYSANVGGIGSLTGTGPNLVMKGALDKTYKDYNITGNPITFASWMAFGVPLSFTLVIIVWLWLQILFIRCGGCFETKNLERETRVKAVIREEYDKLVPVTFGQGAVFVHFVVLAVLWVTRDLGGEYGWGFLFEKGYVEDGVPSMFIACSLFIFPSTIPYIFCARPSGNREPLQPLLSWKAAVTKVPWGVVFLLGGGFAMAHASSTSGLSDWVGKQLTVLDYRSPWVLNLALCYIVAAMTEVTSNTATCTLMMPILSSLAIHLQQSPIYLMFPTAIATSFAFMLPVATPPNAVVFSYGYVRVIDMAVSGIMLNVICVLVLIGFSETLGDTLFDFHTIPDGLQKYFNNGTIS